MIVNETTVMGGNASFPQEHTEILASSSQLGQLLTGHLDPIGKTQLLASGRCHNKEYGPGKKLVHPAQRRDYQRSCWFPLSCLLFSTSPPEG